MRRRPEDHYPMSSHCYICRMVGPVYGPFPTWPGTPPGYLFFAECNNCGGPFRISYEVENALNDRDFRDSDVYRERIREWLIKQPRTEDEVPELRWVDYRIVMNCANKTQYVGMPMGKNEIQARVRALEVEMKKLKQELTDLRNS